MVAVAAACLPCAVLPNTGVKLVSAELGSEKASPVRDVQRQQPKSYVNAKQAKYLLIIITSSVLLVCSSLFACLNHSGPRLDSLLT